MSVYQLSIEEVGFIMGYLGEREAAAGYLIGLIGQQNNDNLTGRIVAASHSLVVRGILKVGTVPTDTALDPTVANLIRGIISAPGSIRCEKRKENRDELITVFLGEHQRIAHYISSEVIVNLEDVTTIEVMQQLITNFVSAPAQSNEKLLGKIPLVTLEAIRNQLEESDSIEVTHILSQHLPESIAQKMAYDLKSNNVMWGSVIHLETSDTNSATPLEANSGFLYAQTSDQLWLFDIDSKDGKKENTDAILYQGSEALVAKLTAKLVNP